MTGDLSTAEDVVQSALVQVWRHWKRVERAGSPESYAHRIVLNEFLGRKRRRWAGEVPTEYLPETAAQDARLIGVEDREQLRRALDALPAGQRAVVVLRYLDDLSEAHTADLLGVTVGTVKSQTSKALATIRERLAAPARQETS